MKNFNEEYGNYFDSDETAEHWLNDIVDRVIWEMFLKQEDWIYMAGELETNKPCLKDNFFDVAEKTLDESMGWLKASVLTGLCKMYADEDIDMTEDIAAIMNDEYGEDIFKGIVPVKK